MRSKEKITKEIVLIRYYNVLFYLFFEIGLDDFKKQCLVSWVASAESTVSYTHLTLPTTPYV